MYHETIRSWSRNSDLRLSGAEAEPKEIFHLPKHSKKVQKLLSEQKCFFYKDSKNPLQKIPVIFLPSLGSKREPQGGR